jgi:hypothetical protein
MEARPMMVQSLLRHAIAEAISEGFINCLIVTSVADANIQLSRIHEHIFARKCFRHALNLTIALSLSPAPLGRVLLSPYPIIYQNAEKQVLIKFIFSIQFLSRRGCIRR